MRRILERDRLAARDAEPLQRVAVERGLGLSAETVSGDDGVPPVRQSNSSEVMLDPGRSRSGNDRRLELQPASLREILDDAGKQLGAITKLCLQLRSSRDDGLAIERPT